MLLGLLDQLAWLYPATSVTSPPPWERVSRLVTLYGRLFTNHYQDRLLADDTEVGHGVHDAQEGIDGLGLLSDPGLVDLELQLVVVEVLLHLLSVQVVDVQVHDGKSAAPTLVAVGKLLVLRVEHAIKECEVVFDCSKTVSGWM